MYFIRYTLLALLAGLAITLMHLQVIGEALTSQRLTKVWFAIAIISGMAAVITTSLHYDLRVINAEVAQYPLILGTSIAAIGLILAAACMKNQQQAAN